MAMDRAAREAVEKVGSCHGDRELFSTATQRVRGKRDVVVVLLVSKMKVAW